MTKQLLDRIKFLELELAYMALRAAEYLETIEALEERINDYQLGIQTNAPTNIPKEPGSDGNTG